MKVAIYVEGITEAGFVYQLIGEKYQWDWTKVHIDCLLELSFYTFIYFVNIFYVLFVNGEPEDKYKYKYKYKYR